MRLNRMVDQRQRLRDLMSEVQENHTDIQRLWKQIEAGGIVWPVGIAAAPPIEEMSSSSSQSSSSSESASSSSSSHSSSSSGLSCYGCPSVPDNITMTVELTSGTWTYSYGGTSTDPSGTYSLSWNGSYFLTSPRCTQSTSAGLNAQALLRCTSFGGFNIWEALAIAPDGSGDPIGPNCENAIAVGGIGDTSIPSPTINCSPFLMEWDYSTSGGSGSVTFHITVTE